MWSSVLVLGLLVGLDPIRLGITLLVISRPRPLQNLLVYWVGCVTTFIPAVAVPLTLLHITPMFKSFTQDWATNSTVRHVQLGMGVLVLSIAALLTVRFWACRRAHLPTRGGNASTLVLDSNTPTIISRLLGRAQDAATEGGSAIRRLLGRVHNAWENGSLWVAFVIGFAFGGMAPDCFYSYSLSSWPRGPQSARRSAPPSRSSSGCLRLSRSPSSAIWSRQRKPKRYCNGCTTGRWLTVERS